VNGCGIGLKPDTAVFNPGDGPIRFQQPSQSEAYEWISSATRRHFSVLEHIWRRSDVQPLTSQNINCC